MGLSVGLHVLDAELGQYCSASKSHPKHWLWRGCNEHFTFCPRAQSSRKFNSLSASTPTCRHSVASPFEGDTKALLFAEHHKEDPRQNSPLARLRRPLNITTRMTLSTARNGRQISIGNRDPLTNVWLNDDCKLRLDQLSATCKACAASSSFFGEAEVNTLHQRPGLIESDFRKIADRSSTPYFLLSPIIQPLMRIFYDYQIFAAQKYGGVSRYFVEIASRIGQYPAANVCVFAPLYQSRFLAEKKDMIPILGFNYAGTAPRATGFFLRFDAAVLRALCPAFRPDIVHETYYSRRGTFSSKVTTVLTVYDMIGELFPQHFPGCENTADIRRAAFQRADHLICISESTRKDLLRLYNLDPEKVSVIHLASSLSHPTDAPSSLEDPYFLYVGGRRGYKNARGLFAAFGDSKLYRTHKLVCFGGGKLGKEESEQLKRFGIPEDRVVIANGGDEMLSRYYAGAVAFVYPSLYEGFGIPLLEAMQCDCPVLCSNSSSMPEVAGDAAIYFEPADPKSISDAILRVAQSPDDRRSLISKGRARVKRFSWDLCAQQTFALYERLLSNQ